MALEFKKVVAVVDVDDDLLMHCVLVSRCSSASGAIHILI